MARLSFRLRTVLTLSLLSVPAMCLIGACGNSTSNAPPSDANTSFGDATAPPIKHHDATAPKGKDSGHDSHVADGSHGEAGEGGKDAPGSTDGSITDAGTGTPCTAPSDCASLVCEPVKLVGSVDGEVFFDAGVCGLPGSVCQCQSPTCIDGVKNGKETGDDCGGSTCPPCAVGSGCLVGTDCQQGECGVGYKGGKCTGVAPDAGPGDGNTSSCVCEVPTCSDGVKNGGETDVDCGGSTCPACSTGKGCKVAGDCSSTVCTSDLCACPAGMTEAPTANSVPYCIDTYEVTYEQYSAFIGFATTTTVAQQPAECLPWNSTFVPSNNWPQVGNEAKNPVNYVDWCDALAYCSYAKKHLCGAIADPKTDSPGGTPIPLTQTDTFQDASVSALNDPSIDEWYNACSSQGQNIYPYSNTYQSQWCNGIDSPPQKTSGPVEPPFGTPGYTLDVAFSSSCVLETDCGTDQAGTLSTVAQGQVVACKLLAPTPGALPACGTAFNEEGCVGGNSINIVYDMSGNVAEWENSCSATTGATDSCAVRGGAYDTSPGSTSLTCASSSAQPPQARQTQAADIGFRCCL